MDRSEQRIRQLEDSSLFNGSLPSRYADVLCKEMHRGSVGGEKALELLGDYMERWNGRGFRKQAKAETEIRLNG